MKDRPFSPWISDRETAAKSMLQRKLAVDDAVSRREQAEGESDVGERIALLFALRRALDRTLRLNPEEPSEGGGELSRLARTVSSSILDCLSEATPIEEYARPLRLELQLLDQRLPDPSSSVKEVDIDPLLDASPFKDPYGRFVAGMAHAAAGEAKEAALLLGEAMDATQEDSAAECLIALELFPALYRAGEDEKLIARGRPLVASLSTEEARRFDLGWTLHWLARAHERREDWRECVEAARESNLQLFRFGASQKASTIGTNYYLVARGMVELEEWGEAAALAQLSLRSLPFVSEYPGRANALMVLVRCLESFEGEKPKADARGIVTRLLEDRPAVADAESFYESVEMKREAHGPGTV